MKPGSNLSVRFTSYEDVNPFGRALGAGYPTLQSREGADTYSLQGTWARVILQGDLVPSTQSTDRTAPLTRIVTPAAGSVMSGGIVTILRDGDRRRRRGGRGGNLGRWRHAVAPGEWNRAMELRMAGATGFRERDDPHPRQRRHGERRDAGQGRHRPVRAERDIVTPAVTRGASPGTRASRASTSRTYRPCGPTSVSPPFT